MECGLSHQLIDTDVAEDISVARGRVYMMTVLIEIRMKVGKNVWMWVEVRGSVEGIGDDEKWVCGWRKWKRKDGSPALENDLLFGSVLWTNNRNRYKLCKTAIITVDCGSDWKVFFGTVILPYTITAEILKYMGDWTWLLLYIPFSIYGRIFCQMDWGPSQISLSF